MKYLLKNIQLTKRTNSRGEYSWMQADLFNDVDIFSNPARLPRFYCMTEEVIKMYEPYAKEDPSLPGIKLVNEIDLKQAIAEGKIPDISHINNIHAITMPLPAEYARVYRTEVKDAQTGAILHQKGDWVIAEGQTEPVPVTAVTLYLKKGIDPERAGDDKSFWVEDPNQVLRRVLERNYKPYRQNSTTDAVTTPTPPVESHTETAEEENARLKRELEALANK